MAVNVLVYSPRSWVKPWPLEPLHSRAMPGTPEDSHWLVGPTCTMAGTVLESLFPAESVTVSVTS